MDKKVDRTDLTMHANDKALHLIAPVELVEKYLHAAIADSTRHAYQSDLAHFMTWGGSIPATPEMVSTYLAAYANLLSPATLERRIIVISRSHTTQGLISPTKHDLVKATMRGIRRAAGVAQRQVEPVLKHQLIEMVEGLQGLKGRRDKALLLLGFAGGFRRSELVGLQLVDINFVDQGMVVRLRRSKTDQEGKGRKIAIPFARGPICPVLALKEWLQASKIDIGAVFRPVNRYGGIEKVALSSHAVAVIIKERIAAIGLDSAKYSGHSLRAGLVTSAAQAGVSAWKIRQQTGHKSDAMLNRYIRDARLFVDNAFGAIF